MMTVHLNADGNHMLSYIAERLIQPDVFDEQVIKDAMEDIEEIVKIEGLAFYSKKHGVKSPHSLSGGMKALMLLAYIGMGKYEDLISNACMGDNCSKYLQRLSLKYDFPIAWDCYQRLDFNEPICAKDAETGEILNTPEKFELFYRGRAGL